MDVLQLLSVLARGDHDAKVALLFAIPDVQERGCLDRSGVDQLAGASLSHSLFVVNAPLSIAHHGDKRLTWRSYVVLDLLCCLFANKALANTSLQPLEGAERDALLRKNTEQSPLLRSQFRKKLAPLVDVQQTLQWSDWRDLARVDKDIQSLMDWDVLERQISKSRHEQQRDPHRSSPRSLASPSHREQSGRGENRHPNNGSDVDATTEPTTLPGAKKKKNGHVSSQLRRRVHLLSAQMESKFAASRALIAGDGLRRNPFETQFPGGSSSHAQMYWCQCTLS